MGHFHGEAVDLRDDLAARTNGLPEKSIPRSRQKARARVKDGNGFRGRDSFELISKGSYWRQVRRRRRTNPTSRIISQ
jgi:hypothetical protein